MLKEGVIMDNKDKTVENALDDIFGTDFIEIDDTNKHDTSKRKNHYLVKIVLMLALHQVI